MWRRIYFLLILVRIYFALSPSYLHPDENFQGPEVIAGRIFSYPIHETWEFTSANPIRSTFPLWLAYGWPMYILRWLCEGPGYDVSPLVVYWTLRVLMLTLSVVMEDWAIHELVESPRARRLAMLLVASSYVTWTFQTHTFSNSLETLLVSWSLVLIQRIVQDKNRSGILASSVLGVIIVVGLFNRITFPAFLLVPTCNLLPHFQRKPFSLLFLILFALSTAFLAICIDTAFYIPGEFHFSRVFHRPVVTPLNNFLYNANSANLIHHGLHPRYQHFLVNLPQLLGPAFPLLFFTHKAYFSPVLVSALSGIALLSIFPHQEARFLIPAIPLILSSIRIPSLRFANAWISAWILFNVTLGVIMGVYHQGGIVPVQMNIAKTHDTISHAFWWKTYGPPTWLLNGKNENMTTVNLMGISGESMLEKIKEVLSSCEIQQAENQGMKYLVAPRSAYFLKPYLNPGSQEDILLDEVWSYRQHLNLDDLDFAHDGFWKTMGRVVGDRGLAVWRVTRNCLPVPFK